MGQKEQEANALLDFDLLSRLVVGIGEVSEITGVPQKENSLLGRKRNNPAGEGYRRNNAEI